MTRRTPVTIAGMDGRPGRALHEARTSRGIDLTEVETSTKIRIRFLEAIEVEDWDLLPSDFYARSFIRTYAGYLKLDANRLVREFESARDPIETTETDSAQIEVRSPAPSGPTRRRRPPPILIATIPLAAIAALIVIWISNQSGDSNPPQPSHQGRGELAGSDHNSHSSAQKPGTTVSLTASEEVWVCLLNRKGRALVDGQILSPGTEVGPFRSVAFTLSLGNGAVAMTVDGNPASIPETPDPIGLSIDAKGRLSDLDEDERPTCT